MKSCSVDSCDRPHSAGGYCSAHYGRVVAHGDPLADEPIRPKRKSSTKWSRVITARHAVRCSVCGADFLAKQRNRMYCGPTCKNKATRGVREKRRVARTGRRERYTRWEIFERDGWICQICRQSVSRDATYPDPLYPSIDHIVPVSLGGDDTRANVQTAHLRCNLQKHAGAAGSQLRLVG